MLRRSNHHRRQTSLLLTANNIVTSKRVAAMQREAMIEYVENFHVALMVGVYFMAFQPVLKPLIQPFLKKKYGPKFRASLSLARLVFPPDGFDRSFV